MPCAATCPTTSGASGGKLRRVAAVPVLSKTRDRIVGAVYVAAESGKRLAEVWKKNLGVEIAILLRGQVLTSTVPESFLSNLPALIEATQRARSPRPSAPGPSRWTVGNDRLLAVAAPFAGQAAEQEGYYVLHRQDVAGLRSAGAAVHHHRRRPALGQLPLAGPGRRRCW